MNTNQLARIASLIGEPARTGMLVALLDAELVQVRPQGRHRYYRLASGEVARLLESMMQIAQARAGSTPVRTGPRDAALRFARTCYDHLAGRLAVGLCDHLVQEGALRIDEDTAVLTDSAGRVLERLGIAAVPEGRGARLVCRPCLDWGERRMHLAGRLGSMLCAHALGEGWLLRRPRSRALELTPAGARALRDALGAQRWNAITDG